MRRAWWVVPAVGGLVVLAGAAGALELPLDPGRPGSSDVVDPWKVPEPPGGWSPPDVVGEGWRARPVKAPSLDFVREQGGLLSTDVPRDAGGELRTVRGTQDAPHDAERVATVRVEVEVGLGADGREFARQVMDTLNDPRGWGHDGSVAFARTEGEADIDITLASPTTTDELCAPVDTGGRVSCGRVGFAVLNAERWAQGAEAFLAAGGSVTEYRHYLVNHEVGHVLGNPHVGCPAPGAVAPIMLQQTLGLDGCRPNGWPAEGG
ncbi:DUF3152 domain-containing protein [Georgenia sp. H159]|uniref:DUF3152 domain-containing protein n=1 Tax=Georgenia sp. H159 TaxID=3076115 RepID=UPI002D78DF79|nr:DUF3152 domain-containing protein [Georgenia sp. H159]